ncbi:MAG: DUF72 domain-containing protein [Desulfococcaceae bacterium]
MVRVGTRGYSGPEWAAEGVFSSETPAGRTLAPYARRFPAVELDFAAFQMPRAEAMARTLRQVPPGFRFAVPLNRRLTHEVDPARWREHAAQFREGIDPLADAERLGAVLVRLPFRFHRETENRRYLAALLDALSGLPLAVEFRHRSWDRDRVISGLKRRNVALVAADLPALPEAFPPRAAVTSRNRFYVRLHGRNPDGWAGGDRQRRAAYVYADAELDAWAERIRRMADLAAEGFVFFTNHVRGGAVRDARRMAARLNGLAPSEAPWTGPLST